MLARHAETSSCDLRAVRRARSTWCRWAPAGPPRPPHAGRRRHGARAADLGSASVLLTRLGQAAAQEPRPPDRGARAARPPEPAGARHARLSDAARGRASGAGARARAGGAGALARLDSDRRARGPLRRAAGFVFPSLYEGFGLPVLEAMSRGVPVACSDRGALAEVAGDAALLFDPDDAAGDRGRARAPAPRPGEARAPPRGRPGARRGFTWERTARGTVDSYRRVLPAPA